MKNNKLREEFENFIYDNNKLPYLATDEREEIISWFEKKLEKAVDEEKEKWLPTLNGKKLNDQRTIY